MSSAHSINPPAGLIRPADFRKRGGEAQILSMGRTVSITPTVHGAVTAGSSSAAGDGNSQQERDQQRAKRRFPRDVAQDAQRHTGLSTRFYRAAHSIDRPFHGVGDVRDGGFRGSHHSRSNLQANTQQPINQSVNCSDMAISTVIRPASRRRAARRARHQ